MQTDTISQSNTSIDLGDRKRSIYFFLTVFTALGVLSITILYPFSMDNSVYQAMAIQLLRFHRLPYVGSWDQNFPGIVYLHALAITLFGNTEFGFRVFDVLFETVGCVLLFMLMRRWVADRVAFLAALFMCALYINGRDWNAGQRDGFAAVFVIAATFLFYTIKDRSQKAGSQQAGSQQAGLQHRQSRKLYRLKIPFFLRAILVGFLVGNAISIRPTFGLFAIVLGIAFLMLPTITGVTQTPVESNPERLMRLSFQWSSLRLVLWFGFGIVMVFVLILLPDTSIPGGLREVYLATIRYNLDVYASPRYRLPFWQGMREHIQLFADVVLGGAGLLFGSRAWQKKQRDAEARSGNRSKNSARIATNLFVHAPDRADIFLFIGYYCSALLSIVVMGKYFRYHYAMLAIMTAILSALILSCFLQQFKNVRVRSIVFTLAIISTLGWTIPWRIVAIFVHGLQRSSLPLNYTPERFDSTLDTDGYMQKELAEYVRHETERGDRIEFATEDPILYWRTELQPASRFTMIYPLTVQKLDGGYTIYQQRWRKEYIDSIRNAKPRLIILANKPDSDQAFLHASPRILIRQIPGFDSILQNDYKLDTELYFWSIYRRRMSPK